MPHEQGEATFRRCLKLPVAHGAGKTEAALAAPRNPRHICS